jgi:hypothetical protein
MKRDGQKAPTALRGRLGVTYHPNEKINATANCLENQFTSRDLHDENHDRRVKVGDQALFISVDNTSLEK